MTDVIEEFYNGNPYPDVATFLGFTPETKRDLAVPEDIDYRNARICIAGCGTCQPLLLANEFPNAYIVGLDISEKSLKTAKQLLDRYNRTNVKLIHEHFENFVETNFDLVLASGVMHHTENRKVFMNKAYDVTKSNGRFRGMVYNKEGRQGVRELSDFFIKNDYSVAQVRKYFEDNPHPFYMNQTKVDVEIADTWLNPRFHEYTTKTLKEEFTDSKWIGCRHKFSVIPTKHQIYFEIIKTVY
jgi:SAM-dependent methyltransferase